MDYIINSVDLANKSKKANLNEKIGLLWFHVSYLPSAVEL